MIKHFLGSWITYWLVVALLPVQSIYPATGAALALQAAFVTLVLLGYGTVAFGAGVARVPAIGRFEIRDSARLVRLGLVMSAAGFAALLYDKMVVQGIDYSVSIAAAREEWRRLGEEREGQASSPFSMVGYLLGSAYFVAVVLAITQPHALSSRQRLHALVASFVLLMANSALTGGRSSILLMIAVVIAALGSRRRTGGYPLFARASHRRWTQLLALVAGAYLLFVFFERARVNDELPLAYVLELLPFLGVEALTWYRDLLGNDMLSALSAMLVLTASYITHSFAITAAIIDGPQEDKAVIFLHLWDMLHRLRLAGAPDGDWFLSGRFPSLPGALWHQFGVIGLAIGSVVLGGVCAAAKVWSVRHPRRLLPLGAFVMADVLLLLSPALFAADLLSYPFIVASFVMLAIIGRRRIGARTRRVGAQGGVAPTKVVA